MYLVLMVGAQEMPRGIEDGEGGEEGAIEAEMTGSSKIKNEARRKLRAREKESRTGKGKGKGKAKVGTVDKDWILKKKELYRQRKGVEQVPRDSKVSLGFDILSRLRSSVWVRREDEDGDGEVARALHDGY